MFGVVTRSQTKAIGTQMPKLHRADKVVDPAPKPETQARREGIPENTCRNQLNCTYSLTANI